MQDREDVTRIDVDKVLRQRMPGYYRFIPRFAVRWLERFICQDELNTLLENNVSSKGVDFCRGVVSDLGVSYSVEGSLPSDNRRVIIVSNHPLGGLDGMILADMVSKQYGGDEDIKFVVNDLLTYVEPLKPIFIGVNKHGAQSRDSARSLDRALMGDSPIIMFPAGLCSRRDRYGNVSDLRWHKMVVSKAIASERNIIPVHFGGHNSQFFYKFARLRTLLGLKFNIEMICLPREVIKSRGSSFGIRIGDPISWRDLHGGKQAQIQADKLREAVYSLCPASKS